MAFKRSTLRYGETPEPVTPYQKAAQAWDERIGSARVQAHNWRLMALGSLVLSLILAAVLLWLGRSGTAVPYVIEIDPRGGARAVGPATETYRPSDAQIAFHLARFIENVRSLSIDPVVVRQSWLKAYDFVTDKAAVTLNEHAREKDPFAKVGRRSVAVEVTSVVRASGVLLPGALAGTDLRGRRAQGDQAAHRAVLHRHHTAEDRGGRAQEPARHLRACLQLVAGRHVRRAEMTPTRLAALAATLALVLSACATRVSVPEIPILDSPAFKAAKRDPEEKSGVKIVEVPKPLPLPGQLKPVPEKTEKAKDDKKSPRSASSRPMRWPRSSRPRTATSMPSRSIPTLSARSTSSTRRPARSPISRSSPARSWFRSPRATPYAGSSATPPAAGARAPRCTSW